VEIRGLPEPSGSGPDLLPHALSKTNDFACLGGSQKNFAIFEDKVFERFIDGNGGRITQQWYMNSDASITEHNLEEFGNTLWNMQRLKVGIKKADEGAYTDSFWTVEYAESWRESHSDSFFLMAHHPYHW
jgi:hypothetical protein